ncbi:S-adenosyl-L-methionine-dependent methyltransferase [Radiomyces spectabilis]|uniref:S-adenosyl-L-methionine-dependent methyltransferase n=1 Tax=Radiomyces spectabilis TaxID=64574 RepID=UPI0022200DDC|nr:S-adenosyl-L-methionine-dependent methyltransferase [Radiomyces spectabilis]KAI8377910.1 S-adenosyl-L-methionine-dependent methyltransferase [Radiomyces spectabilis]
MFSPSVKRFISRTIPSAAQRHYASTSASTGGAAFQVFNRDVKRRQKDRAAMQVEESRTVDYLKDVVAGRVADRLLDIKREFGAVVDLGSGCGHIVKHVDSDMMQKLIMCDMSVEVERKVVDEEHLPFEEDSIEAVVSSLSLNWVNDLPGALIQIRRALKPDGVFIGAMFGGDTLFELRTSLQLAEVERESGISPRVSPMTDSSDVSRLLSRAGFTLTTVDVDEIQVNYPSAFELMQDLRSMGEKLHGNPDGTIPATFQVIYMIGWKPSATTPLPKKRGSANVSMKDVLEN